MKTITYKLPMALTLAFFIITSACADPRVAVRRDLPEVVGVSQSFTVTLAIDVNESNKPAAFGLTEYFPVNWTVSNISNGGMAVDEGTPDSRIEWLFWSMGTLVQDRNVTYTITVPAGALGAYSFNGTVVDNGNISYVTGDTSVVAETRLTNVSRDLPQVKYTGSTFTVTLLLDVGESDKPVSLGISEIVPAGWSISAVSNCGVYFQDEHKVEWIISNLTCPVQDTSLAYTVTVPSSASIGEYSFHGTLMTAGNINSTTNITGDKALSIQQGCNLKGDEPPCGVVPISEVIVVINQWASGSVTLADVIALINSWASG